MKPYNTVTELESLNDLYERKSPEAILAHALESDFMNTPCVVSSFGAESVALLHMISRINPSITAILVDTGKLFNETLRYRDRIQEKLGLETVLIVRPRASELKSEDPDGTLHVRSTDDCCDLRKVRVLDRALAGYGSWISGRKRYQSIERSTIQILEIDTVGRLKLNPLANSSGERIRFYIANNDLPMHPLVSEGYPSIGCLPCTSKVSHGADPRSGRWQGQNKTECGIHNGPK